MTTITLPRAVVEQALEALKVATTPLAKDRQEVLRAQDALRAELAQQAEPVEPVAWEGWWLHHGQHNYRAKPLTSERVKELMKLAFEVGREAAPPQQPTPSMSEIQRLRAERDALAERLRKVRAQLNDTTEAALNAWAEQKLARHGIPMPEGDNDGR